MRLLVALLVALLVTLAVPVLAWATPSASISASHTQCPAPCTIQVSAKNVTDTNGSYTQVYNSHLFEWDFGETTGLTWAETGHSRDTDIGGEAAHTYRTPGTYDITLRVTSPEGLMDETTVQITIDDPEVLFAGAATKCVVNSGSNFTGCPHDTDDDGTCEVQVSNCITEDDLDAWPVSDGSRTLYRAGDTFDLQAGEVYTGFIGGPGEALDCTTTGCAIGSFDASGPYPDARFNVLVDNTSSNSNLLFFAEGEGGYFIWGMAYDTDSAIVNTETSPFESQSPQNTPATAPNVIGLDVMNSTFSNMSHCLTFETGNNTKWWERVFFSDVTMVCDKVDTSGGANGHTLFGSFHWGAFLGVSMEWGANFTSGWRMLHSSNLLVAHSRIVQLGQPATPNLFISLRACESSVCSGVMDGETHHVSFRDSYLWSREQNTLIRTCNDRQCNGGGDAENEFVHFERNFLAFRGTMTGGQYVKSEGGSMVWRNNVFDLRGAAEAGAPLVNHSGTGGGTNDDNVIFANNTVYSDEADDQTMFQAGSGVGHECDSNLVFAPNAAASVCGGGVTESNSLRDGADSPGRYTVASASQGPFVATLPSEATIDGYTQAQALDAFQLAASNRVTGANDPVDSGTDYSLEFVHAVLLDQERRCRPDSGGSWDVGAHELGGDSDCLSGSQPADPGGSGGSGGGGSGGGFGGLPAPPRMLGSAEVALP